MSENSEPILPEQETAPPQLSHQRILAVMAIAAMVGSLLSFIFISWRFGVGVLIGGVLSLVNYYWMKRSLEKIFDRVVLQEKPRFLATRYISRYLVFGIILAIVYLTKIVPVISVILGLASFAVAIMIEGFIRIFTTNYNRKDI
ncbi:MAG TPA: ATP synthase subunit I [Pyrinomonadaceae bacterium]|nr:ATP synthase subunit I [Pyrinomonadaceae bacterium]